jgi:glycosyltransferase involved in cell wall biosynthesis
MADTIKLSVVIPLFNEAESLPELHQRLTAALAPFQPSEIIFIDDGSTDDSMAALEKLAATDTNVKVIRFRKNYGKAAALAAGFQAAQGALIITMGADLQDDPAEIPNLVTKLNEGYDLVSGWKVNRRDPITKTLPSKLFNAVTGMMVGLKLHDFNCGLKGYRREVTEEVQIYGDLHRYIPALAHLKGFKVTELGVLHHPRKHGKSKYGWERYARGMLDLLTILFMGRYKTRPLHLFGSTGLAIFAVGIIIDLYVLSLKIRFGNIQNHAPLLLGGILLTILGIQFVSTGLLAELITNTTQASENQYTVRKKLGF